MYEPCHACGEPILTHNHWGLCDRDSFVAWHLSCLPRGKYSNDDPDHPTCPDHREEE